ncbi:MAG: hypothetical protein QW231_06305 [Candidatus Bathyarchaeia archaeon]
MKRVPKRRDKDTASGDNNLDAFDLEAWIMAELERETPPEIDESPWKRAMRARRPAEIESWLRDWGHEPKGEGTNELLPR